MKKLLLILSILILNSNIALAANNLVNADWWKTATLDKVKAEIANGADLNAAGTDKAGNGDLRTNVTPLMFSLKYGNPSVETIETLIKAGANVNAKEQTLGLTPLIYAVDYNVNPKIIQTLVEAGADVNAKSDGRTALFHAAHWNNNPEVINALIKAGADVNAKIESGESKGGTALMVAAQWNNSPEVTKALIKAGADVNAKRNDGATALMLAVATNKNSEIAKILIDVGADKMVYINNQRFHVIIGAFAASNQAVVDLLLQDYKKADYSDKAEFDANFESCLATEQYHQDVKSSMSQQQQLEMFADNFFSGGRTQRQMSNDCKCIFEVIAAYLGEEKFKKTMADFEQGRYGSAKKTFRTAIPAAFLQCY